jgi:hypothetical protein
VLASWLGSQNTPLVHTALSWWAARGDTALILALIRNYDAAVLRAKPEAKAIARYYSNAARAYLALSRHDSATARRGFIALSDTLCLRCDLDRLTTARLLAAAHQAGAADKILRQRIYSALTPVEVRMAFDRARVAEALGQRTVAARAYRFVINAWGRGDPEAQALVHEAQQALIRVNGG